MGLAEKTGIVRPDGSIPHVKEAMMSDAIGTTCGAFFGSSTITTYVESASGIAEGGKSGVTSFTVSMFFLIALFLSPVFASHSECCHQWSPCHGWCPHARFDKGD